MKSPQKSAILADRGVLSFAKPVGTKHNIFVGRRLQNSNTKRGLADIAKHLLTPSDFTEIISTGLRWSIMIDVEAREGIVVTRAEQRRVDGDGLSVETGKQAPAAQEAWYTMESKKKRDVSPPTPHPSTCQAEAYRLGKVV